MFEDRDKNVIFTLSFKISFSTFSSQNSRIIRRNAGTEHIFLTVQQRHRRERKRANQ